MRRGPNRIASGWMARDASSGRRDAHPTQRPVARFCRGFSDFERWDGSGWDGWVPRRLSSGLLWGFRRPAKGFPAQGSLWLIPGSRFLSRGNLRLTLGNGFQNHGKPCLIPGSDFLNPENLPLTPGNGFLNQGHLPLTSGNHEAMPGGGWVGCENGADGWGSWQLYC